MPFITAKLEVTGLKEAEEFLKTLETKVAKQFTRTSLREGAKPIQRQAKADVPKLTGNLEKKIKIKGGRARRKGQVVVRVTSSGKKNSYTGDAFYGSFLEYGYNKVPTVRNPHTGQFFSLPRGTQPTTPIPGKHFLMLAAEKAADQAVADFKRKLGELVSKEKAKAPTAQS